MNTEEMKAKNLRTGLILGSIAILFFAGVIVKHIWFA
jgi:hypothetical protein